ncbi:hypothetical protein [Lactobacillus sp. ESL0677]|uniref:hypothetical protein n=1 Tax=Lactobacillus sp. ESL0677 TaxID=2983208 RepID=UPI0023F71B9B|nr:hypothetical protein [Lactobacillus sp. ESL0677]WEV36729.1 hypothetical protein OZX76_08310 [Lactobacillus sp. ESL0677]
MALITDSNGVDDWSFNQGAWQGFKDYRKELGYTRGNLIVKTWTAGIKDCRRKI